jgi:hypothetical protein
MEFDVGVLKARDYLLKGRSRREAGVELLKAGVKKERVKLMVTRAITLIKERTERDAPVLRARLLADYEELYNTAVTESQLAVARACLHDRMELLGLSKKQIIGKQVNNNTLNMNQVTLGKDDSTRITALLDELKQKSVKPAEKVIDVEVID